MALSSAEAELNAALKMGDATRVAGAKKNNEPSRAGNKRKADGAHPEDPERKH